MVKVGGLTRSYPVFTRQILKALTDAAVRDNDPANLDEYRQSRLS
jgi:hypothetical protein